MAAHLSVYLTSVTDHWATAAVAGPKSRDVLQAVCADIDFAREAFPFMSYREGTVAGVAARVMRISFSGELAYEVNVIGQRRRARVGSADGGRTADYGITPYGTETMHVLRAEKGFIIVGQDTDGSVTPLDLGMEWIVAKSQGLHRPALALRGPTRRAGDRKQLVGLLTEQPKEVLPEGSQIVGDARLSIPARMQGHVTSAYFSAFLDRSIALAMLRSGHTRMDEIVHVALADGQVTRRVVKPIFVDPEGRDKITRAATAFASKARWWAAAATGAMLRCGGIPSCASARSCGHLNLARRCRGRSVYGSRPGLSALRCRSSPTRRAIRANEPSAGYVPASG